jgi:phytanoyl-CoA hydroxylase
MAGTLSADQVRFYQDNGYIILRGVFPRDEMARVRADMHTLADRLLDRRGPVNATWGSVRTEQTRIEHCHDVQFHCASVTRLISDQRFTGPLQSIVGENVQLHHTKMFIKPPEHGSPFPLHQDYPYFPHTRMSMTAAVIHFDDSTLAKGCVRVVPGSYKDGPRSHQNTHDHHLPLSEYPLERAVPCEAGPGDVLIFSYLTIHGSGINASSEPRTTLLVQVRDPEDLPTVATHQSNGQGMMLAGIDPTAGTKEAWHRELAAK